MSDTSSTPSSPHTAPISKTLRIVGPANSGREVLAGCLLYKARGIPPSILTRFSNNHIRSYSSIVPTLLEWNIPPTFDTVRYRISYTTAPDPDIMILVISTNPMMQTIPDDVSSEQVRLYRETRNVIVCVSGMETVDWAESRFLAVVEVVTDILDAVGVDTARVPFIPVDCGTGANFFEFSALAPWFERREGAVTLLEALDGCI